jgi:hypothetical protein
MQERGWCLYVSDAQNSQDSEACLAGGVVCMGGGCVQALLSHSQATALLGDVLLPLWLVICGRFRRNTVAVYCNTHVTTY